MAEFPIITIGITCYNAQDTIKRAVQSAVDQEWESKDILVVDDCSTDQSADVLSDLKKTYPDLRVVTHENNQGAAAARNTLVDNAKGEYIAFFDDDDESLPTRLTRQYERIQSYERETGEAYIACYVSGQRLYPNGYRLPFKAIGTQAPIPYGTGMADQILFFGGPKGWSHGGTPSCSLMIKVSTIKDVGGFDVSLRRVEDLDLAVRLSMEGAHFIGCPEVLLNQYVTWSEDKGAEANLKGEQAIVEKHKAYLKGINRYIYARDWPRLRYYHFKKRYIMFVLLLLKLLCLYPVAVTCHILKTGPARVLHERKMNAKSS